MLVPTHLLERAVTLSASGMQAAIICGPAFGGALYVTGATTVYVCGAVLALLPEQPVRHQLAHAVALRMGQRAGGEFLRRHDYLRHVVFIVGQGQQGGGRRRQGAAGAVERAPK